MGKSETSKKNIKKAIATRKMIGIQKDIDKLSEGLKDNEIKDKIISMFNAKGINISTAETKNENQ